MPATDQGSRVRPEMLRPKALVNIITRGRNFSLSAVIEAAAAEALKNAPKLRNKPGSPREGMW